ncbi:hypothetical protein MUY27_20125 [Mucilaginibacter sp. RS28]|uniref:Fibronectin type-III domain-containing protein n=1 Tax=Mucilaginibacter straminoryzae TaxID=2932774 RepID=A0A9X1X8D6_9SPHI|nr:hypothetical protein [Mucilaginibacter straminoryzae]MCJ8212035.1 hypothetical protein [Mucilaginibacter straminoryzae]
MKNPLSRFFLLFASLASLYLVSCKDLIEPSIEHRDIQAQAPGDKYQTTNYTVGFWWDEVEDALKYRLQVVNPKFDSVAALVLDTLVKSNKFSVNLGPGNYQWRVRAENGSSQTAYSSPRSFTIFYSSLKQQRLQVGAPANNLLTNQSPLTFSWGTLYGATKYHIQIDTANFVDETKLYYDKTVPGQQLSVSFSKDLNYQWRVRAENDTAQSQWSAVNYFTVDRTAPAAVTLLTPTDKSILQSPVSLSWNSSASAVRYRLYLYQSDGKTTFNSTFPLLLNTTTYNFTGGTSGNQLYWKVTALDAAGNESQASELRTFTIQ